MKKTKVSIITVSLMLGGLTFGASQFAIADSGPVDGCPTNSASKPFPERFSNTNSDYRKWNGDPAPTEPSWRKDVQEPPLTSPPFPITTWPIGETETIGYDNQYYGALMDTLYCGPNGKAWKDSRVTVYGWIAPSFNIS